MTRQYWFIVIIFFSSLIVQADSVLVAVLMVKNEEPCMEMTLQPLVDAGVTDYLIYDTGSIDNTIQVTQDFFIKNNISNFVIEQGEWVDFSVSRNRALELTEQHFPDATFMLMLDAEWILHNGDQLLKYCHEHKNDSETLYFIRILAESLDFYHARLIRCRSGIEFFGKVHEVPTVEAQLALSKDIYFQLSLTHYGIEKSRQRWLRDRDILLQELEENINNTRASYYLAQTYFALQDYKNAEKWYEHRITLLGFDEEHYIAMVRLAQTCCMLQKEEKMIYYFLQAFGLRPCRAEALILLAEYYYHIQSYQLCYMLIRYACTIPYPAKDVLFIEKKLYEFTRYDLLSSVAYYVGDFKLGEQATLKAIAACPDRMYLYDNLKEYQKMLY